MTHKDNAWTRAVKHLAVGYRKKHHEHRHYKTRKEKKHRHHKHRK